MQQGNFMNVFQNSLVKIYSLTRIWCMPEFVLKIGFWTPPMSRCNVLEPVPGYAWIKSWLHLNKICSSSYLNYEQSSASDKKYTRLIRMKERNNKYCSVLQLRTYVRLCLWTLLLYWCFLCFFGQAELPLTLGASSVSLLGILLSCFFPKRVLHYFSILLLFHLS